MEQTLSTPAKLGMVTMEINPSAIVTTTTPTQHTQTVPITMDTIMMDAQKRPRPLTATQQGPSPRQHPEDMLVSQLVAAGHHPLGGAVDMTANVTDTHLC